MNVVMSDAPFRRYECVICGFIYDEAEGLPEDDIAPGTRWARRLGGDDPLR